MKLRALFVLALAAAGACAPRAAAPPAPVGSLVVLRAPEGGGVRYAGSEACRRCHALAYGRWRQSAHARAYAGLADGDRANPACLRCHVTGAGDPLGFVAGDGGLASVGCEACHGPAADHAEGRHPELVPTATGGECAPCEVNRICRLCHTPARSPEFDLAAALRRVACDAPSSRR